MRAVPPPFPLPRIDHVTLLVDGMERAVTFYRDVIGCRVRDRLPQYGMVQFETGAALIDLVDVVAQGAAGSKRREQNH